MLVLINSFKLCILLKHGGRLANISLYMVLLQVEGNDMMTGLQLPYSKGQDMGVFSLRVAAGGSSSNSSSGPLGQKSSSLIDWQDPGCVHGTVHMPAIVVYLLYQQAISSGQFRHYQPLLKLWTGMLPSLLIHSRTQEYIDPGAVALKLDFWRVAQGRAVVCVGEVLRLQVCFARLPSSISCCCLHVVACFAWAGRDFLISCRGTLRTVCGSCLQLAGTSPLALDA